jgi:hypothetical protein
MDFRAELAALPPPTEQELERDVILAALEVRRVRMRLARFGSGVRASNALDVPRAVLDQAVERLAVFREAKEALGVEKSA